MVAARPAALLAALVLGSAALTGCGISDEVTLPTAVPSASLERPTHGVLGEPPAQPRPLA